MKHYKLADLVRDARGGAALPDRVTLPPIEETKASRVSYLRAMRQMLREIAARGRAARDRFDFEQLAELSVRLGLTAESAVVRILGLESARHTETFMATAKRALGVDLREVVRQEDLEAYLEAAAMRNASLIKNFGSDAVNRVAQTVTRAVLDGQSARVLQARLSEQFRISDRRAQLIAQDQMAKLNADLNRIRHEQAGVTEYSWMTSHDERVRPLHRALDGKVYKYGEPTGAEDGLPPGQPVRCRCIARGIVQF